jgi:RNA polymerase sigma-54 factor
MLIQSQSPSLRPVTTAHLAQTMTLMGLQAQELRQRIEADVASNPALEIIDHRRCPGCGRTLPDAIACPVCSRPTTNNTDEAIIFLSSREDFFPSRASRDLDEMPQDEKSAEYEDLSRYVMRQIAPEILPKHRPLAAHILTSLDDDGLLRIPLIEFSRYHHLPVSEIKEVLHLIQHADPIGVGSTSPQEALLVQLEVLAETRPIPKLASKAIEQGMDLLSRRQYGELARLLGVPTPQAKEIAVFISDNLNPYPARAHWGSQNGPSQADNQVFTTPDVIISLLEKSPDSALVVEVISPLAGRLRINPLFRQALVEAPEDRLQKWQEDYEQAVLLIKCLQQRDHTIVRLMQLLVKYQRQFILYGDAHLEPMTRASLAKSLEVHESTISRAVANKAVQLPNGHIISLSRFFDRSLHIRTALRKIIAQETNPLTDTILVELLREQGYCVARRTVAKYRSIEGILPAHLRAPLGDALLDQACAN